MVIVVKVGLFIHKGWRCPCFREVGWLALLCYKNSQAHQHCQSVYDGSPVLVFHQFVPYIFLVLGSILVVGGKAQSQG